MKPKKNTSPAAKPTKAMRGGSRLSQQHAAYFSYLPAPPWNDPFRQPSAFDDSIPVTSSGSSMAWPRHA